MLRGVCVLCKCQCVVWTVYMVRMSCISVYPCIYTMYMMYVYWLFIRAFLLDLWRCRQLIETPVMIIIDHRLNTLAAHWMSPCYHGLLLSNTKLSGHNTKQGIIGPSNQSLLVLNPLHGWGLGHLHVVSPKELISQQF